MCKVIGSHFKKITILKSNMVILKRNQVILKSNRVILKSNRVIIKSNRVFLKVTRNFQHFFANSATFPNFEVLLSTRYLGRSRLSLDPLVKIETLSI